MQQQSSKFSDKQSDATYICSNAKNNYVARRSALTLLDLSFKTDLNRLQFVKFDFHMIFSNLVCFVDQFGSSFVSVESWQKAISSGTVWTELHGPSSNRLYQYMLWRNNKLKICLKMFRVVGKTWNLSVLQYNKKFDNFVNNYLIDCYVNWAFGK